MKQLEEMKVKHPQALSQAMATIALADQEAEEAEEEEEEEEEEAEEEEESEGDLADNVPLNALFCDSD